MQNEPSGSMSTSQEIKVKGKAARVRGATWTHDQVEKLFEVWTQPQNYKGLLNEKKKQGIFKSMAATLTSLGVIRTWQECRAKIKNLKADFRKAMEKKTPFRYYDQMWKVMNLDGSASATSGGGAASSSRSGGNTPTDSGSRSKYEDDYDEHSDMDDEDLQPETITPTKTIVMPNEPIDDEEAGHINVSVIKSPSTSTSTIQMHTPTYYEGHSRSYHESEYITPTTPPSPFLQRRQYSRSPQDIHRQHIYEDDEHEGNQHQYVRHHFHHHHQQQQEIRNEYEQDSSSRSSMIITHVVSNVVEPITTVVMPSSSSFRNVVTPAPPSPEMVEPEPLPQPIRLEFVVDDDNDNLVLQTSSQTSNQVQSHSDSTEQHQFEAHSSNYQPRVLSPSPPRTTAPSTTIHPRKPTKFPDSRVTPIAPPKKRPLPPTPPSAGVLRQRLKQKRPSPVKSSPAPKEKTSPIEHGKKRKLLETLNKRTVETISNLLTETSQTLLKEIQDAEQRFIVWEEEKRNDERRREEAMFSKLMHAMKAASSSPLENDKDKRKGDDEDNEDDSAFITTFSGVSKRLNAMVNDEIKATEETLKQWEMKMQRQESRHSEKLFAMIINAIKTPTSQQD